ncbi:MAG: alpha/beta fold hydrolase [Bacteroidota bacterium]
MNLSKVIIRILLALLFLPCMSNMSAQVELSSKKVVVTSEGGEKLKVESGYLTVPENRTSKSERSIQIAFQRIATKSKNPAPPIFMLAGGPGGSWIRSLPNTERFREVQFYSQFADVIVFDQRGAGNSVPSLGCNDARAVIPLDQNLSQSNIKAAFIKVAEECRDYWLDQGVDLSAYNTDENANDLNDLRKALGYEKIILIGGSYGSHLGLHFLRKYTDIVDRAIFYGLEGPNHTFDNPKGIRNTLQRIAAVAEQSDYYRDKIPEGGLLNALQEVIDRVNKNPETVILTRGDKEFKAEVNGMLIQRMATFRVGRRSDPLSWPDMILAMYNGEYEMPARMAMNLREINSPSAMFFSMDFASWISPQRKRMIDTDPAIKLLGDINAHYNFVEGVWPAADLGEDFTKDFDVDVPVLLVHGTWDMSTPLENAQEVHAMLSNSQLLVVNEGTHGSLYNLYENWKPIFGLLEKYVKGEKVEFPTEVDLPPIEFPENISQVQVDLWEASYHGDLQKARKALAEGADVNALDTRKSRTGRRALNWAAQRGQVEIIKLLLENGADINASNKTGFTPIHHAVEACRLESFKLLKEKGADLSITTKNGVKPITTAKRRGCEELVDLIKQK